MIKIIKLEPVDLSDWLDEHGFIMVIEEIEYQKEFSAIIEGLFISNGVNHGRGKTPQLAAINLCENLPRIVSIHGKEVRIPSVLVPIKQVVF